MSRIRYRLSTRGSTWFERALLSLGLAKVSTSLRWVEASSKDAAFHIAEELDQAAFTMARDGSVMTSSDIHGLALKVRAFYDIEPTSGPYPTEFEQRTLH